LASLLLDLAPYFECSGAGTGLCPFLQTMNILQVGFQKSGSFFLLDNHHSELRMISFVHTCTLRERYRSRLPIFCRSSYQSNRVKITRSAKQQAILFLPLRLNQEISYRSITDCMVLEFQTVPSWLDGVGISDRFITDWMVLEFQTVSSLTGWC